MAKSKTASSDVKAPAVSIPNPVRSIKDKLGSLRSSKKPSTTAKVHVPLPLTPEAKAMVQEWIPLKILWDHLEGRRKRIQKEMDESLNPLFFQVWWDTKSFPASPTLNIEDDNGRPDMEAKFIFKETFRIGVPAGDDPNQAMINLLVTAGISSINAIRLVETELVIAEEKSINLTRLLQGAKVGKVWVTPTPLEQSAAEKLIAFLTGEPTEPLTDEEVQASITTTDYKCVVKPGFLARATTYCESLSQLKAMMMVFKPQNAHVGAKFGLSDSEDIRKQRLISAAAVILTDELGKARDDEDDDED